MLEKDIDFFAKPLYKIKNILKLHNLSPNFMKLVATQQQQPSENSHDSC